MPPKREGTKQITVELPSDLHLELKIMLAKWEKPLGWFGRRAIEMAMSHARKNPTWRFREEDPTKKAKQK